MQVRRLGHDQQRADFYPAGQAQLLFSVPVVYPQVIIYPDSAR